MLLENVYLLLILYLIRVPLSSFFFFFFAVCRIHSLSLPSSFCLDCILLLEGLPLLRSPLTRMFFLPFTYFAVVFCLFRWFLLCLSFCCLGFVHYYERSELLIYGDGKKRQVCSDVESTNRCLLKSIELPEAFWCRVSGTLGPGFLGAARCSLSRRAHVKAKGTLDSVEQKNYAVGEQKVGQPRRHTCIHTMYHDISSTVIMLRQFEQ